MERKAVKKIPFMKMSGSGNDFIFIDHREPFIPAEEMAGMARKVCRHKVSVGADGLVFIEKSDRADFKWRVFNPDGSEAEMCGNAGRCVGRFALCKGIAGPTFTFETMAGILSAEVDGRRVKLQMTRPQGLKLDEAVAVEGKELILSSLNTGVPHAVLFLPDLEGLDVARLGRAIRSHPHFAPAGTNANFVRVENNSMITVRTYERGVEDETLACGTGTVASALIAAIKGFVRSPVSVKTTGGEVLTVHYELSGTEVKKVFFEGEVRVVYEGEMWEEAWR
jgi:diaminopimelate epimerase